MADRTQYKYWDILVLDTSGSMFEGILALIEGYNSLLQENKERDSTSRWTTITFNTHITTFKDSIIKNVKELTKKDIYASGRTALFDAIGFTFELILKSQHNYDLITVNIITDGCENASKAWTSASIAQIKSTIEKTKNLSMIFIGADAECLKGAKDCNIVNTINYRNDISFAFRSISENIERQRSHHPESDRSSHQSPRPFIRRPPYLQSPNSEPCSTLIHDVESHWVTPEGPPNLRHMTRKDSL